MPPGVLRGRPKFFCLYDNSQMNPQTYAKFGPNRSSRFAAFPGFESLTPKPPQMSPWIIEGVIVFSLDVHSQINLNMYAKFGANRSRAQDYKEKHKTRLKTNVKRTVLNNTIVTSFLSTDCELSTNTCSKNVYNLGPSCLVVFPDFKLLTS